MKTTDSPIVLIPNMIHVTCVANGIKRVCGTIIRLDPKYPNIDNMVSCVKNYF